MSVILGGMAQEKNDFLEQLKKKDPTIMAEVVRQHTGHLYKACLGLGFPEFEAEDLVQNVWITFFDVLHSFEGRSSLRTFLFGILYNKASELRKKQKRIDPTEDIEQRLDNHFDSQGHWILSHSPISPDKFYESTQTLGIIAQCLDLLPLNQKMAFVLKEVQEELTEEICRVLSVTATNLGVLLFRARNQLRECVEYKSK